MSAVVAAIALGAMREATAEQYVEDEKRWSSLMASAQAGNERDYRQLLGELSDLVSRYLHARLGGYDFVEDCVQEVLIAVHEARHTYDGRRPFRPWLFAIVRYKSIDAIRRAKVAGREVSAQQAATEPLIPGPEAQVDSDTLLAQLPESLRQPLELTRILGLSTAEAAVRLDISETALKVRVHRAVKRLRKLLETEPI